MSKKMFLSVAVITVVLCADVFANSDNLCKSVVSTRVSGTFQEGAMGHAPKNLFDGIFETPWGLNSLTGWIEFDLKEPVQVQRVVIDEGLLNRIQGYIFKAKMPDGTWKELVKGGAIGYRMEREFEPVTAKTFRLDITNSVSTPGLWQIELYNSPAEKFGDPRKMAPPESVKKFRELGLGAWIIWGPQSLSELEISFCRGNQIPEETYDNYPKNFDPQKYNPESWIRILKKAGFKYVVYVPKHHDGFCLWDTKTTDHNIMNSPFGRDIVKDLVAACKKEGMEFCLYYSVEDSYNPDCIPCRELGQGFGAKGFELPAGQKPDYNRYVNYMKTHLKELSDISGDCLMWWFDANWNTNWSPERGRDLYRYMRKLQPKALFSNRIGSPFASNHMKQTWFATEKSFGDYATMEFHIPSFRRDAPWEYTQTSSDTYSYSKTPIKSAATQIYLLVNTITRDGNFLLASSILPDGSFDERLIKEFDILGKWLDKYGESIYETRGGPYMPSVYYASTCRDNTVYLHIFRMDDDRVVLPALGKKILSIERLGGGKVEFEQTAQNVTIKIDPKEFRSINVDTATGYGNLPAVNQVMSLDTIVKLKLDGNAFEIAPIAPITSEPAINIEPTCRATGVELNTVLSWRVGDGPLKKKIKKYELVVGIGNPANNEIILDKTLLRKKKDKASYKLPAKLLTPDRKYWWRVDEIAGATTISGDVCTFKTRKETAQEKQQRFDFAKEFMDAKYGAFICWDMSALIGGQISWVRDEYGSEKYDQLYKSFEGSEFDADEWARIIARSGLKYLAIVPKHHAGFCMWDTKTTDYNIMNTPFGRDWLAELVPALRKEGIKVGLYWTIMDWYQPSYAYEAGADLTKFNNEIQYPQLKELLTNYGDIFCLWVDGQWDKSWTQAQGRELYDFCRKLQPNMVINNRCGPKPPVAGPIGSALGSFSDEEDKIGDYLCPERVMGAFYTEYPWETCLPLDKNGNWSWMPPFDNRSKKEVLSWLLEAAGGGGNLLLSLTPDANGKIDPRHAERYMEVGDWLYLHGDHFYGTRTGPYKPGPWGVSLHKNNKVYLYITDWSSAVNDTISLPKLPAEIVSYKLLSGTIDKVDPEVKSLIVKHGDKLEITVLPGARRDFTIVEIVLDKDAGDIEYIDTGKRQRLRDHTTPPGGHSNV